MTRMKSKWLILFMVFSLFLVACGGGSDDAVEDVAVEEPAETLDAPLQQLHLLSQKKTLWAFA